MGRVNWEQSDRMPVPVWLETPANEHDSRKHLRRAMQGNEGSWRLMREFYADQAGSWQEWVQSQPGYYLALERALARIGRDFLGEIVVEIGSGAVPLLGTLLPDARPLALDVNIGMLRDSNAERRLVADVRRLPFATASVSMVAGLNSPVVAEEASRVLGSTGLLVLAYSFAEHTPIYTPAEEILARLPERWEGLAARGEWGEYAIFGCEAAIGLLGNTSLRT